MIKMAAVSSCLLLLQPYWTLQNDNLAVAVTQTEQVHHSWRSGSAPRLPVSFARASISSPSPHSSSAQFISPERPSYTSALLTLPRESITSCQEKGKVPWGRFKEKLKLKVCSVVRAEEKRANTGMRKTTTVGPWKETQVDANEGNGWSWIWGEGERKQRTGPPPAPPHCPKQPCALTLQFLETPTQVLLLRGRNYWILLLGVQKSKNSRMVLNKNDKKWWILRLRGLNK